MKRATFTRPPRRTGGPARARPPSGVDGPAPDAAARARSRSGRQTASRQRLQPSFSGHGPQPLRRQVEGEPGCGGASCGPQCNRSAEERSMDVASCAAVDLGASSGRVVVAESDGQRLSLREAARFETPLVQGQGGYQCWDIDVIEARLREGLAAAEAAAPLASVGVDTWGVDFVLLDEKQARIAPV